MEKLKTNWNQSIGSWRISWGSLSATTNQGLSLNLELEPYLNIFWPGSHLSLTVLWKYIRYFANRNVLKRRMTWNKTNLILSSQHKDILYSHVAMVTGYHLPSAAGKQDLSPSRLIIPDVCLAEENPERRTPPAVRLAFRLAFGAEAPPSRLSPSWRVSRLIWTKSAAAATHSCHQLTVTSLPSLGPFPPQLQISTDR